MYIASLIAFAGRAFFLCLFIAACSFSACDSSDPDAPGASSPASFASISCDDIASFTRESATYRVVGTSITFTTVTEGFDEMINGYDVVKVYTPGDTPVGLGEYAGCSDQYGFLDVATDSWDAFDPNNTAHHRRNLWEPPMHLCKYGTNVGTSCDWAGLDGGEPGRTETKVVAYETVVVPYGRFENVMKLETSSYDEFRLYDGPNHFWLAEGIGFIRAEDLETGDALELMNYTPPAGKRSTYGSAARSLHNMRSMLKQASDW